MGLTIFSGVYSNTDSCILFLHQTCWIVFVTKIADMAVCEREIFQATSYGGP